MDYAAGITFEKDPNLDGIPTHHSEHPSASDGDAEANDEP